MIEGWAILPERIAEGVPNVGRMWLIAEGELLEARVRADVAFFAGASDEEAMIRKFVERSLRLNEHLRRMAQQQPLSLLPVSGGESPEAIADRIEALLRAD